MKKILLVAAALISVSVYAQDPGALKAKLSKSDAATEDPKKNTKAATWVDRATIYYDLATVFTNQLVPGLSEELVVKAIGTPQSAEEAEIQGVTYKKYVYPTLDLYFNKEGNAAFWFVTAPAEEGALDKSVEALIKAYGFDNRGFSAKGTPLLNKIKDSYNSDGIAYFSTLQYQKAAESFSKSAAISELPAIGKLDTMVNYYAGLCYAEANDYPKAKPFFEKVVAAGYEQNGTTNYYLSVCQEQSGESDKALATLQSALSKYPDNQEVIIGLIAYYANNNKDPKEVMTFLDKAIAGDPNNATLYLTQGAIWEQLKDNAEAEKSYLKSIELNPKQFESCFNLGLMYAKQGDVTTQAAEKLDVNAVKEYDEKLAEADVLYKKAIQYLEQGRQANVKEKNTLELLKNLYFRYREDAAYKAKYDEVMSVLETL